MAQLALQLVTWNAEKYLPTFFLSLQNQFFKDWVLFIWDNASTDSTIRIINEKIKDFSQKIEVHVSEENKGFAFGHNQLLVKSEAPLVCLLSSDMYMADDCLQKLVFFMNQNSDFSAVAPRLMRWNFDFLKNNTLDKENIKKSFTTKVDSLGLKVLRNRRVIDLCQGEEFDSEKYSTEFLEVFGVSGAMPMYRRSALLNLDEFFDPLFESYKEDVDLAFRLRWKKNKSAIVLGAVAYHDRQVSGDTTRGDVAASFNKMKQNSRVKYFSYRNHLFILYKNEDWRNFALDWPFIVFYELKKFAYFLLFDRVVLRAWIEFWKRRKMLKSKRITIKKSRKNTAKEMRGWWK